jgi:P2 family phage contractile tail tube protein
MAKIEINRLTNANIYIDGNSLLGRAEEIQLPQIKSLMQEHKALGMVGKAEFFAGLDKMDAKIKWASMYADVLAKAANPMKTVQLQVRASLETYEANGRTTEAPVVAMLTGAFKTLPMGTYKQHENSEFETEMSVYYAKLTVGGTDIVEIDVLANIYKVSGVDVLATYRANIGG